MMGERKYTLYSMMQQGMAARRRLRLNAGDKVGRAVSAAHVGEQKFQNIDVTVERRVASCSMSLDGDRP